MDRPGGTEVSPAWTGLKGFIKKALIPYAFPIESLVMCEDYGPPLDIRKQGSANVFNEYESGARGFSSLS